VRLSTDPNRALEVAVEVTVELAPDEGVLIELAAGRG
jgi:hypothetical protein